MRVFLLILALFVILAAAAGGFVWWKIGGLKQQLVVNLESTLKANVQINSLDLDLWKGEVHAAGISLANQSPDAPWDTGEIDQATGSFHVLDLLGPTLPLRVSVSGWKISLHTTVAAGLAPTGDANTPAATEPPPLDSVPTASDRIRVNDVSGNEGEVAVRVSGSQTITVHGVMFTASTHGGAAWTTDVQCSSIAAGTLLTGAGAVHLQSDAGKITFTDLAVHCGEGLLAGNGAVTLGGTHAIHGTFTATSIPMTMLVAERWQMKLSGLVSGDVTYQSDDASATANGKMSVSGAKFNVLPLLGKVTSLVGLPDISGVELDQATCDVSWKDHALQLQNIDVRKKDVLRVGGQLAVAADGQCDGRLKLGLPATVTARWPRLQTEVFSTPLEDYNWTDVHVTGTPDSLQEDLSPRLLAVGAAQGGQLIQQTTQKATDLLNSLLK
jgi:hypothetical protein